MLEHSENIQPLTSVSTNCQDDKKHQEHPKALNALQPAPPNN